MLRKIATLAKSAGLNVQQQHYIHRGMKLTGDSLILSPMAGGMEDINLVWQRFETKEYVLEILGKMTWWQLFFSHWVEDYWVRERWAMACKSLTNLLHQKPVRSSENEGLWECI